MEQLNNQVDFLEDKSSSGKLRDWSGKKKRNLSLAEIYMMIKESYRKIHSEKFNRFLNREERSRMCATVLQFKKDTEQKRKLHQAYFCQLRLCPVCNWRRSLKIFSQVSKIIQAIEQDREHAYIFLTLTQKNVSGEELDQELDKMMKAWRLFIQYKKVKDVMKGSYRGLEITYDKNPIITKKMYQEKKDYYKKMDLKIGDKNPNFDMYHPHFHVLIVVRKGYFTSKEYLSYEAWRELWAKAMRLDYLPQVNVKRVKGNTAEAIAEVAKYAAKDSDYVIEKNIDLSMSVVETLDYALQLVDFQTLLIVLLDMLREHTMLVY